MKRCLITLLLLSYCGGSAEVIDESTAVEDSSTTSAPASTTSTQTTIVK